MMKSAAEQRAMKTQMSVMKTFFLISVCFVICWSPNRLYFFLYNMSFIKTFVSEIRYATVFMAFLNVCLNPFIYAAKLDPVKKRLSQKLCKKLRRRSSKTDTSVMNIIDDATVAKITVGS